MSIIRIQKDIKNPYARVPNAILQNPGLTWEARGLLAYLLSKPDGWEVRNYDLIKQSPAKESVVKRIIKELINNGYMYRHKISEGRGTIKTVTVVFEDPKYNINFSSGVVSPDDTFSPENYTGVKSPPIETTDSNKQQTSETKENSGCEKISDYLQDAVDLQGKTSEATGPNPDDQWLEYGSKIQRLYARKTGIKLNEVQKGELALLTGKEGFDWGEFQRYLDEFAGRGGYPYDVKAFVTGYTIYQTTGDIRQAMGRPSNGKTLKEYKTEWKGK